MAVPSTVRIAKPSSFRGIEIPGVTIFQAQFCPEQRPALASMPMLSNPLHPLYPVVKRRYDARDPNSLWWNVYTNIAVSPKRVVRSWLNRRTKNAIVEALKVRGYDADGRSISGEDVGTSNLRGSMNILTKLPMIVADFETVKEQAGQVIDRVQQLNAQMGDRRKSGATFQTPESQSQPLPSRRWTTSKPKGSPKSQQSQRKSNRP
ncbi:MAG: hypothetical protein M1819_004108 [Sarea resinae]|nr:MAG: hypothetical protein M1819_004108 [Sarea resinae]